MARLQLKIWRAPLATLQTVAPTGLAEGEIGIASETNTIYKRPDGNASGALIPLGGGATSLRAKAAATSNITLSGTQTIDGIALVAGDNVLLTGQTTASQNGLYTVSATTWTRAAGANTWTNLISAIFIVEQGTASGDTMWLCTSDTGGTLETTALTFRSATNKTVSILGTVTPAADALPYFTGTGTAATTTLTPFARTILDDTTAAGVLTTIGAQPVDADLTALAGLSTYGMIALTAAGTAATRSLAVSGTGISVSNADGIAGNPTITSNATSANTASTIVARDASGNFTAGTITAALTGNASTATTLATARTIAISGDGAGTATSFNGSANITIPFTLAASGVTAGTYSSVTVDAKGRVTAGTNSGSTVSTATITSSTITGSTIDSTPVGATAPSTGAFTTLSTTGATTIGGDLTLTGNLLINGTTTTINSTVMTVDDPIITLGGDTAPTANDGKDRGIEFRYHNGTAAKVGFFGYDANTGYLTYIPDATNTSEVFSGTIGTISANLTGNAGTATKLATARTIAISGDGTGTATSFDGSAAISIPFTLAASGVAAGTYSNVTVNTKGLVTAASNAATVTGGTINSTPIGATTASTGAFTTLTASGATTFNGTVTVAADPTSDMQVATKRWVESLSGKNSVRLATTTDLGVVATTTSTITGAPATYTANGTTTASSTSITMAATAAPYVKVGATITGTGIPASTTVAAVSGTTVTISNAATAAGTVALTFTNTITALSIDGVAVAAGDRVLVKNQTGTARNGIYTVTAIGSASVQWVLTRASDGDTWADLVGAFIPVEEGASNAETAWICTVNRGGTLGTTAVTFQLAANSQLAAFGGLSSNGIAVKTGAGTAVSRSIAVSGTGLSVSNADGVAGNPTVTSNATSANTASTIVARDASGNFTAGTITATSFNGGAAFTGTPTAPTAAVNTNTTQLATTAFVYNDRPISGTLTVSTAGTQFTLPSAIKVPLIIAIDGVLQEPTNSFTVSAGVITFTESVPVGSVIFALGYTG